MKIYKYLKKVQEFDYFGHPIELNFNRKGNSHKTICGGFISLIIKMIVLWYSILNIKKLVFNEGDSYATITWATNFDYLGEVGISEIDQVAISLRKARE